MEIRFNRSEISAVINSLNKENTKNSRKTVTPNENTFAYLLSKARAGNEMAAVQIDEWQRFCKSDDSRDKHVLELINKAAEELFG
jgi:hypothetical protein